MRITVRQIVVAAAMIAIVFLLGMPPMRLGFIPFVLGVAITVMHIPVIIGAVMEGPLVGGVIGLFFGLLSLYWAYTAPTGPSDAYFKNPLISILPRLFIGPLAYLAYRALTGAKKWKPMVILAVIGLVALLALILVFATPLVSDYAAGVAADPTLNTTPEQVLHTLRVVVLASALPLFILAGAGIYLVLSRWGELAAIGVAAVVGTLTNTVLVLTALGLFGSMGGLGAPPAALLLAIGVTNGIPETIAAVLITVAVVAAWKQIEFGRKGARIFQQS